jgi:hypothetical protein
MQNDSFEFKRKLTNIHRVLGMLADQEIITESQQADFELESWRARTLEDLQDLIERLAAICEGKHPKKGGRKNENHGQGSNDSRRSLADGVAHR